MNNQRNMGFHELANMFPLLEADKLASLAANIIANGLLVPIVTYQSKILDGRNRYNACLLAGVEPKFEEFDDSAISHLNYVISQNLERRHLIESQRAMVAGNIAKLKHGLRQDYSRQTEVSIDTSTLQDAADIMNVGRASVARAHRVQNHGIPELIEAVESGELSVSAAAEIASLPQEEQQDQISKPHIAHNSGDNEWYTPSNIITSAITVIGEIDLDPASSEVANELIKARIFYKAEEDGLSKPWKGKVWMNPPYSQPLVTRFCEKLIYHFEKGDVPEAIALLNNATETKWFQNLAKVAPAICHLEGRVTFWHPSKVSHPLQGQVIFYLGNNPEMFTDTFSSHGVCFPPPYGVAP